MPTAATFIAVNAALTAQAAAEADRAHAERCKIELANYEPRTASVQQMRSYAECVNTVFPTDESDAALKVCVASLLVCALLGAIIGAVRSDGDTLLDSICGALLGLVLTALAMVVIGALLFVFN